MAKNLPNNEKFLKGLKTRKEVLGNDYVDQSLSKANDLQWIFKNLLQSIVGMKSGIGLAWIEKVEVY